MKTIVPCALATLKLIAFLILLLSFINAHSQPGMTFKNPTLKSGTDLKKGAVYLFKSVSPGVDATVTVDDLVNGAELTKIDDNSGGLGYTEAFQPEIKSGKTGESYVAFTIRFIDVTNGGIPEILKSLQATALDIDGSDKVKEFDQIDMNGGKATYMGGTLEISLKSLPIIGTLLNYYRADNIKGLEKNGIDTSSKGNMYTVSQTDITGFSVKFGAISSNSSGSARQYSLYMKGFQYPNVIVLPLKLLSFDAVTENKSIILSWNTTEEINLSSFTIERSTDQEHYSTIGSVQAKGNETTTSTYRFTDSRIEKTAYYRLRCMNADGSFIYSPVQVVRPTSSLSISTYPNPFSNQLTIQSAGLQSGEQRLIELFNSNGQLILSKTSRIANTEILETSSLDRGIYIIRITQGTELAQSKVVKY
jgi:hypothetical protein